MTKRKGKRKGEKKKASKAIQKKKAQVAELVEQIKKAKLVAVVDIRALPDWILQSVKKSLRGKAEFKVAKNSVIKRALDAAGYGKELGGRITSPTALVLSNELSAYQLFRHFRKNRKKVAAKPGQVADEDIVVVAGETDLPPGPALSELKGAKINAQIKAGKIVVAKDSVVAKKGEKITGNVCKALQKLNILPFTAGLNMACGFETNTKFMYESEVLDIDEVQLASDLASSVKDALNMSINCSYPTELNRDILLGQAVAQARALASEGGVYSPMNMETLLASAIRAGGALVDIAGTEKESAQEPGEAKEEGGEEKKE